MKKSFILVFIFLVFMGISYMTYSYVIEQLDVKYSRNQTIVPFFNEDITNIIIEDNLANEYGEAIIQNGEILLPFEAVKKYLNQDVFYDGNNTKITITTKDTIIRMDNLELEAYLNDESFTLDAPSKYINDILYMPVVVFKELFNIEIEYIEKTNVVIIDYLKNYDFYGYINNYEAVIIKDINQENIIYKEYDKNDIKVKVFESFAGYTKVRSSEGIIGYIETKYLNSYLDNIDLTLDIRRTIPNEIDTMVFAWQAFYSPATAESSVIETDALNVISPTWYKVVDNLGNIENYGDINYISKAHELGYQVWPMVSNVYSDIDLTSEILHNSETRENIIKQLIAFSELYKLDGICMDFEHIYLEDKDAYVQFIRELCIYAHKQGLKVGVATGVPDGSDTWSLCYDHERLAEVADYIMLMSYDQHSGGSSVAGSQAQVSWIEEKLLLTLDVVDNKQVVMGIPLYTRLWRSDHEGVKNVKNLSITKAKELIVEKNAALKWDEESGQYIATYYEDGYEYNMWIEDESAIKEKIAIVNKYDLKGICLWEINWGNDDIWPIIQEEINKN